MADLDRCVFKKNKKMKVLLTGANGYIGKRLLPVLLEAGHDVICCVRDQKRFPKTGIYANPRIEVLEIDFLNPPAECPQISEIDAAYYLIHSMSDQLAEFEKLEMRSAENFLRLLKQTKAKQIIYLGGITNDEKLDEDSDKPPLESSKTTSTSSTTSLTPPILTISTN